MAKGSDKTKVIEIPAIDVRFMTVKLVGVTPLLCNRFGDRALAAMEQKQQKKAAVGKEARDPEEEFRDALYLIDGDPKRYGFPGGAIKKSLVTAGGRFTGEFMTVLRGVISIMAEHVPINGTEPVMRKDRVRLTGGTMSIAYRPMFERWSMDVPVKFNAAMLSEAQLVNLVRVAGFAVGLGPWRPECNGIFGQFTVEGVES